MGSWDNVTVIMKKNHAAGRPRAFDPDVALHQALMVFWNHGYEGASMAMLLEATGLTAPQVYRAFGSKEQLFEHAVRLYQEEFSFGIDQDQSLVEGVADFLDKAAREFTTKPGLGCLVSTGLLATGQDAASAAAIVRVEREHALEGVESRVARAVSDGELSEGTDVEGLARTIGALIQGMSVQARDGASYEELARIVRVAGLLCEPNESSSTRKGEPISD